MTAQTSSKSPSGRVKRTPVSTRNVLTVKGKEPGYHYRIVNDQADRIEMFKEAGYEVVEAKDVVIGDKRVGSASPDGSLAQVSVGKGDKAYLLRIKQEWYDEDQAAKEAKVRSLEESMKQEATQAGGQFKIERSTKF